MRPRSTAMRSLYVVPEVAKGVRTPSTSTTRPPAPVLNARATLRPAEVAARESMVKRAYSQSDNIHRVGLRRCVSVQCEVPQNHACSPCASQSQPFALLKKPNTLQRGSESVRQLHSPARHCIFCTLPT